MIIPAGQYARTTLDGREVIDPASFQFVPRPDYPIWRWFTAPLEVLGGPNALTLITIILFILMVGASFAVLEHSGVIKEVLVRFVINGAAGLRTMPRGLCAAANAGQDDG